MPLDFLKRKTPGETTATNAPAPPTASVSLPEEVIAQEYLLKLYYAGKSSEGVRMKAGPNAMSELPSMLHGLAKSEIEVVEPLPIEFSQATPVISRPSEAMQWLNAHHIHSPVTRHALVVLESIDAIDLAFDTFVAALLTRPAIPNTARSAAASRPTGTKRRATWSYARSSAGAARAFVATRTGSLPGSCPASSRTSWPTSTRWA